jgi:hypothetical protein
MTEIEIGNNMVVIISLIVNAVLAPLVVHLNRQCTHLKSRIGQNESQ